MRRSRVMEKIRAGEAIRIAMTGHVLPPFLAYAAHNGYDCIWLDMEHHPLDDSEVRTMLAFAQLFDVDVLVRPNTREKMSLGRYLEDGAAGLAIPQVSTADEVRDLVSKVKYPPLGDRGMGQPNLQARYGLGEGGDHVRMADHALRETFLLVQLETPTGLANLDEMAAVPGFEGLLRRPDGPGPAHAPGTGGAPRQLHGHAGPARRGLPTPRSGLGFQPGQRGGTARVSRHGRAFAALGRGHRSVARRTGRQRQ